MSVTNCTRSSAPVRPPDSLRNPSLPPGTDTMPEIEQVVFVLMLEDHSYDNFLGATGLSRQRGSGALVVQEEHHPDPLVMLASYSYR